ncbi:glutamate/tyrosine decarboxylase-like PLP-dependent enzyme [Catenulispora sp. GAS73]|uniref:SHOCT domain-containing protein n=1 Tax=Catenulispora sp. GAS73 TaxID=3156269 RepID=UPI003515DC1B
MGLTRKFLSFTTLGVIKYRTSNQKTARNTKKLAKQGKQARAAQQYQPPVYAPQAAPQRGTPTPETPQVRLDRLERLRQAGTITQAEYEQQRAQIIREL